MAMYLKNEGTSDVSLPDFLDITILAGESIDISGYQKWQIQQSADLVSALLDQRLVLNDGFSNITPSEAVSVVRGVLPIRSTTTDGKIYTVNSARPLDSYYYVTGAGDDMLNNVIGGGQQLLYNVPPGETLSIDATFNEDVMFLGGRCSFDNAVVGSWIKGEIIAPPYHPFPALNSNGNTDLNAQGQFVPNANATGKYWIYPVEKVVFRFINKMHIFGMNREVQVTGPEPSKLAKHYPVRVTFYNASDTEVMTAQVSLEMYRRHTL